MSKRATTRAKRAHGSETTPEKVAKMKVEPEEQATLYTYKGERGIHI
jgi:hypothetical protein